MQIVIDIDEKRFRDIQRISTVQLKGRTPTLEQVIASGTPLPKGHGAIKDVSQIEIPMCEDRAYETWVQVAINAAPTIIEADIESEDRNENKN